MMGLRMRKRNIARETTHLRIEAERMLESSAHFSLSWKLGIALPHMFCRKTLNSVNLLFPVIFFFRQEFEVPCSRSVFRSGPGGVRFSNKVNSESSVTQNSEGFY